MNNITIYSPAMFNTFEDCPLKFYKKYIQKLELLQNSEYFETGKNIHALANYYLNGERIEKFELALTPNEKKLWQNLKSNKYFQLEKIKTEFKLTCKVGNNWISGRLDALVKDNKDNYYILDFKTGQIPKDYATNFQTIVYLLCTNEYLKPKVIKSLNFIYIGLKETEEKTITLTPELKKIFREKIRNICTKIKLNTYPEKNNCQNCEYKPACKY